MKDLYLCEGKPLSLVILSGGSSRRMQWDKALLPAPGGTIIEYILDQLEDHFDEVLISVANRKKFSFLKHRLIVDDIPGEGPMMGIKTALDASKNEKNFVIACDIPHINLSFLQSLIQDAEGFDITVPLSQGGRKEPLFAVYTKSVLREMEKLLDGGVLSLLPLLESCRVRYIPMGENAWFKNLNTREDYEDFLERTDRHQSE
jgi:molybdopterin-guanine dinucleotide biosynthesis protein A